MNDNAQAVMESYAARFNVLREKSNDCITKMNLLDEIKRTFSDEYSSYQDEERSLVRCAVNHAKEMTRDVSEQVDMLLVMAGSKLIALRMIRQLLSCDLKTANAVYVEAKGDIA